MLQVTLIKSGHTYIFRYWPGQEGAMIEVLADKASDEDCPIDWLDAALLTARIASGRGSAVISDVL